MQTLLEYINKSKKSDYSGISSLSANTEMTEFADILNNCFPVIHDSYYLSDGLKIGRIECVHNYDDVEFTHTYWIFTGVGEECYSVSFYKNRIASANKYGGWFLNNNDEFRATPIYPHSTSKARIALVIAELKEFLKTL